MAPFFGASTIVWANTIGVVLLALSVGYWLGGRLADRHPHLRGLCLLVLIAAGLLALVPIVARPFLDLSVDAFDSISVGAFAGSLFGVLALVAVPVLLLGAVAPWALRLELADVRSAGETAGRLYAISTVGSLLGTFTSSLLLIPLAGTQRTFLIFAVALAAVAALGLGRRFALAPLAIAALLLVPVGTTKAAERRRARGRRARDGVPVRARRPEPPTARARSSSTRARRSTRSTGPDTVPDRQLLGRVPGRAVRGARPPAALAGRARRRRRARWPAPTAATSRDTHVDAVEIDGELTELGKRWFGLRDRPGLRFFTEDARPFLRRSDRRYDAIFVDAYRQPYIPFYLSTREFFALVARPPERRTAPWSSTSAIRSPATSSSSVLTATLRTSFAHVAARPGQGRQHAAVASARRARPARALRRRRRRAAPDRRRTPPARLAPPLRGGRRLHGRPARRSSGWSTSRSSTTPPATDTLGGMADSPITSARSPRAPTSIPPGSSSTERSRRTWISALRAGHVAAARHLKSSYCMLAHGSVLLDRFMTADELRAAVAGHGLDAVDAAVMAFAEKVVEDATAVTRPTSTT